MANEAKQATGSYATCIASSSTVDGAFNSGSKTAIGNAIATEDLYPLLDFKLDITSGTPGADTTVDVYRRPSDGVDQQPSPSTTYLHEYVGSFALNNSADEYYLIVTGKHLL